MTCGAAASLCIAFRAIVSSPKDEILAIAPFFPEYKIFAEGAGASFRAVPPDTESFGINFDALEPMITPDTCILIINSPNNPSGAVLSRETLSRLSVLLRAKSREYGHAIYIVADEPYREITYGAPALMQKIIARCADMTSDIDAYRKNRDLLYSSLIAFGYECVKPEGAFYLFVKAPGGDSRAFSEKAKTQNLLLVPGDDFGCPGYVRISYCVSQDMIKRSLNTFRELI